MGTHGWRLATVLGLAVGAVGIGILWASGRIDFPFYPPPGFLILVAGALGVALLRASWAPALGTALGVFMVIGFLTSSGMDNLTGAAGPVVAIGSAVQMTGMLVALVAGTVALRKEIRQPAGR